MDYGGLCVTAAYGATVERVKSNMGISPRENLFKKNPINE